MLILVSMLMLIACTSENRLNQTFLVFVFCFLGFLLFFFKWFSLLPLWINPFSQTFHLSDFLKENQKRLYRRRQDFRTDKCQKQRNQTIQEQEQESSSRQVLA